MLSFLRREDCRAPSYRQLDSPRLRGMRSCAIFTRCRLLHTRCGLARACHRLSSDSGARHTPDAFLYFPGRSAPWQQEQTRPHRCCRGGRNSALAPRAGWRQPPPSHCQRHRPRAVGHSPGVSRSGRWRIRVGSRYCCTPFNWSAWPSLCVSTQNGCRRSTQPTIGHGFWSTSPTLSASWQCGCSRIARHSRRAGVGFSSCSASSPSRSW